VQPVTDRNRLTALLVNWKQVVTSWVGFDL